MIGQRQALALTPRARLPHSIQLTSPYTYLDSVSFARFLLSELKGRDSRRWKETFL